MDTITPILIAVGLPCVVALLGLAWLCRPLPKG